VGKDVVLPAELAAVAKRKDSLRTKFEQDYCWIWGNKSTQPIVLTARLA